MSFVRRAWESVPSLSVELENKGSVARDHLAGERTFLAWLRTSLALVSLGVAIAQLFKLPEIVEPKTHVGQLGFFDRFFGSYTKVAAVSFDEANALAGSSKLDSLEKLGKPLGSTCIALGALCLVMGAYRYYVVQSHLIKGVFPPSRIGISVMALLVGSFIIASFGIIVGAKLYT